MKGKVVRRTMAHEIADFVAVKPLGDRYGAMRRIMGVIWPDEMKGDRWNEWTERTMRQLCDDGSAVVSRGTG